MHGSRSVLLVATLYTPYITRIKALDAIRQRINLVTSPTYAPIKMGICASRYDADKPILRSPDMVWVKALQRRYSQVWTSRGRSQGTAPYHMFQHVYLGDEGSARRMDKLQSLGITHVLNCAGDDTREPPVGYEKHGIKTKRISGRDAYDYDMMQHYDEAKAFIEEAKVSGGNVLVHCVAGINRSGVITLAYMMDEGDVFLLEAIEAGVKHRGVILTNQYFQAQLVRFARSIGKLRRRKAKE